MRETQVGSLSWEDPLEKGMSTNSSIFDWRNSWTEEPGGLQSMRYQRVGHNGVANTFTTTFLHKVVSPQCYIRVLISLDA